MCWDSSVSCIFFFFKRGFLLNITRDDLMFTLERLFQDNLGECVHYPTCSCLRLGKYSLYHKECISQCWVTWWSKKGCLAKLKPSLCRRLEQSPIPPTRCWEGKVRSAQNPPPHGQVCCSGRKVGVLQNHKATRGPAVEGGWCLRLSLLPDLSTGSQPLPPHTNALWEVSLGSYLKSVSGGKFFFLNRRYPLF